VHSVLRQRDAEAESERNKAAAAKSDQQVQQAVRDREELRAKLLQQFNAILATRDTARGLVVNLSDVLFDTGKYTLKPGTQISLAKVSGILQSYPGLKLQVEGYTDNTGSDMFNQKLSENRADAVRSFLIAQGVSPNNITSTGYGESNPVADNSTSAGRAKNRRVQLVVSGDAIGVKESSPVAAVPAQPQPQANPNAMGTSNPPQQ